jgi:hypothetical protein
MNETAHFQTPKAASSVWIFIKRIFAAIVIVLATIGLLGNAVGLVSIWVVRQPARDTVKALSTFVTGKLGMIDQGLARISARADEGKQALARVNDATSKLGDRFGASSLLLTALTRAADDDLAPRIAEMRTQAAALHDGIVSVNAALETLDSVGFINIPAFPDELSAISERIDAAQNDVQGLGVAINEARTAASSNLVAAVTARTTKIDKLMAQIKSVAVKYQAAVAQKRQRLNDLSYRVLRAINLLVLSLIALFLVAAAGQMLLIYVCWQYVRRGRLPLLRVSRVNLAAP